MSNWDRSIDLFVNVGSSPEFVLLASKTSLAPAERPALVSGDKHTLRLWFIQPPSAGGQGNTILMLDPDDRIVVAGKVSASADDYLFTVAGFAEVTDSGGTRYEAVADLNTEELYNALAGENAILGIVELEVQNNDNTQRRSLQFPIRINRQAYAGEIDPVPAVTNAMDTLTQKRGTIDLDPGEDGPVTVEFETEFSGVPSQVRAWITKKAGAPAIQAFENHDSITEAQFTVDLGNAIPADAVAGDYKLEWIALL